MNVSMTLLTTMTCAVRCKRLPPGGVAAGSELAIAESWDATIPNRWHDVRAVDEEALSSRLEYLYSALPTGLADGLGFESPPVCEDLRPRTDADRSGGSPVRTPGGARFGCTTEHYNVSGLKRQECPLVSSEP